MKILHSEIFKSIVCPLITFLVGAVIMYSFTSKVEANNTANETSSKNKIEISNIKIEVDKKADKFTVDEKFKAYDEVMKNIQDRQETFDEKFDKMYSMIIDIWKGRKDK